MSPVPIFTFAMLLGAGPIAFAAAGDAPSFFEQYRSIIDRNPFGLRPVARHTPISAPVATSAPKLYLTGIVVGSYLRVAFFEWQEPGKPPRYSKLSEGKKDGALELLLIVPEAGLVIVRMDGREFEVSFAARAADLSNQLAEQKFIDDHVRAHEERERLERERRNREQEAQRISQEQS